VLYCLRFSLLRFQHSAPVAQLDRAMVYETIGREFEPLRARHLLNHIQAFPYFVVEHSLNTCSSRFIAETVFSGTSLI
jgi:hypothetical protein